MPAVESNDLIQCQCGATQGAFPKRRGFWPLTLPDDILRDLTGPWGLWSSPGRALRSCHFTYRDCLQSRQTARENAASGIPSLPTRQTWTHTNNRKCSIP